MIPIKPRRRPCIVRSSRGLDMGTFAHFTTLIRGGSHTVDTDSHKTPVVTRLIQTSQTKLRDHRPNWLHPIHNPFGQGGSHIVYPASRLSKLSLLAWPYSRLPHMTCR